MVPEIDQRAGGARIQFQHLPVGFDGLLDRSAGLFEIESLLEPGFRLARPVDRALAVGKALDPAQPGGVEIEKDLPADRLHFLAREVDRDLLPVGDDAKLRQRVLDPVEFFAQRRERAADLARPDVVLAQLDEGLESDEVLEGVGLGGGDQPLALPASKLARGDPELAAHIRPRVLLLRGHANILTGRAGEGLYFAAKST